MEIEIEILNIKDEINALKKQIAFLKEINTKLIDDTSNLSYKYSELDNERLKIIVENEKIRASMVQVTQPTDEPEVIKSED
jgi:predicted nuclease with TOPRIM domain